jgi:hypothetical protein
VYRFVTYIRKDEVMEKLKFSLITYIPVLKISLFCLLFKMQVRICKTFFFYRY